ncbi:hypothetical protein F5X96DRAFT_660327, partial [Biscogniauxia mediterranea]
MEFESTIEYRMGLICLFIVAGFEAAPPHTCFSGPPLFVISFLGVCKLLSQHQITYLPIIHVTHSKYPFTSQFSIHLFHVCPTPVISRQRYPTRGYSSAS